MLKNETFSNTVNQLVNNNSECAKKMMRHYNNAMINSNDRMN